MIGAYTYLPYLHSLDGSGQFIGSFAVLELGGGHYFHVY